MPVETWEEYYKTLFANTRKNAVPFADVVRAAASTKGHPSKKPIIEMTEEEGLISILLAVDVILAFDSHSSEPKPEVLHGPQVFGIAEKTGAYFAISVNFSKSSDELDQARALIRSLRAESQN